MDRPAPRICATPDCGGELARWNGSDRCNNCTRDALGSCAGCGRQLTVGAKTHRCRECRRLARLCATPGCGTRLRTSESVCAHCSKGITPENRRPEIGERLPDVLYALPDPATASPRELCLPISATCAPSRAGWSGRLAELKLAAGQ